MPFRVKLCRALNKLFPGIVHPFNLQSEQTKTYAEWQFDKGEDTIKYFCLKFSPEEMFANKTILDIGCGAAGKTLYFASKGVTKIYGLEYLEKYRDEANALAEKKQLSHLFEFVQGDASQLPFDNESIDAVIMNDVFEHLDEPDRVLQEAFRVLRPSGRIYLNFPPYHHPFGAHLHDAIGIPWVHLIFSDKTLIKAYKAEVANLPDGAERVAFRISVDAHGQERFSYINKMSLRRAHKIFKKLKLIPMYYREVPLRRIFTPIAKLPILKEGFLQMVVCVFEKEEQL